MADFFSNLAKTMQSPQMQSALMSITGTPYEVQAPILKQQAEMQQMQQQEQAKAMLDKILSEGELTDEKILQVYTLSPELGNALVKMRESKMGLNNPAAVQEYEYYSKLSPEKQAQYLGVKRAQQTLNLGGTQAVLDPVQGGIREEFNVTPKPEQMPDFKAAQAYGTQSGKQEAELEGAQNTKSQKATDILPIIAEAKQLLPNATSGGLATNIRDAKQYFGYSGKEAETDARLNLLSAALTASVPRFEGPQGVLDVQLYKQAAADVGNSTLNSDVRAAALDTMEQLQRKYAGRESTIGQPAPQPQLDLQVKMQRLQELKALRQQKMQEAQ